jgi:D-glycero-alpha-D-manno-heptose-7-phosphate kinase
MEFFQDDKVIVNPLRVRSKFLHELAHNLILYYTETSRESAKIISSQAKNVSENKQSSIEAMDNLKVQATQMKESLLKGELDRIGQILDFGWQNKKAMAAGISNPLIDDIYQSAISAGATGGKISGAGGGGFMIFYAPGTKRFDVIEALKKFGGRPMRYQFTNTGLTTWTI